MNNSEYYFILKKEIYISKEYFSMSEHAALADGYKSKEERYVIRGPTGNSYLPASLYESYMREECIRFQELYKPTRDYRFNLDKTYFRYYDDAEEVLRNLKEFYKWAKNQTNKKLVKFLKDINTRIPPDQNFHSLMESQIGLSVKRRSDLNPIERMLADERDLF